MGNVAVSNRSELRLTSPGRHISRAFLHLSSDAGRVWFTAPNLFEASLFLGGAQPKDAWFFDNVTFLFTVGGDQTGMQGTFLTLFSRADVDAPAATEFPRIPAPALRRLITNEADARLTFYLHEGEPPPGAPPRPTLPENMVDAPLVRLFNFLRERRRSSLSVRRSLTVSQR